MADWGVGVLVCGGWGQVGEGGGRGGVRQTMGRQADGQSDSRGGIGGSGTYGLCYRVLYLSCLVV